MHIALVHQAALGDTLLLIPLLRSLRFRFPAAHLTLVSRPAFGQLLKSMGHVDSHADADAAACTAWFSDGPSDLPPPPWSGADLLLSAVSTGQDAWAGHARRQTKNVSCFHPRPPTEYPHHVTSYHRGQLAAAGLELLEISSTAWQCGAAPKAWDVCPADAPILLHPGAGSLSKCWPTDCFLALAHALESRHPVTFVLGEAELERFPPTTLAAIRRFPTLVSAALPDLALHLGTARLYIGNDAGPTHLAAAVGTPTLALFGPTDPIQWAPVGSRVTILRAPRNEMAALEMETVLHAARAAPWARF